MSTISQGKKKKADRKFFVRLLVWILIIAMLAGTFYYMIYFVFVAPKRTVTGNAGIQVAAAQSEDDYLVRVALEYGSSVAVSYKTAAEGGYAYGYNDAGNNFIPLGQTHSPVLFAVCRENVALSSDSYVASTSPTVGAYHICVCPTEDCTFEMLLEKAETHFSGIQVFPAYIGQKECVMVGSFFSEATSVLFCNDTVSFFEEVIKSHETEKTATEPPETVPDESDLQPETVADSAYSSESSSEPQTAETTSGEPISCSDSDEDEPDEPDYELIFAEAMVAAYVSKPTVTAVMFVDPSSNLIIWEFDCPESNIFPCLQALQNGKEHTYIYGYKSSGTRTYDGTLEFATISGSGYHGIRVINVLPLETYVGGVIPYEIGNSWPLETQKAFAIAVRSYVIANKGYHEKAYHADICCTSCCQVYKGFASTNDRVRQAVRETKGQILTYGNKICVCMYSSSTGGSTSSSADYGGASNPYLSGTATPWELYTTHTLGSWYTEYTPKQLYSRLSSLGYTSLKSNVAKIDILELAKNSTYVKKVRVTDTKGNTAEISGTAAIKKAFAVNDTDNNKLRSSNFVVGRAGETVERINLTALGFNTVSSEPTEGVDIQGNPYLYSVTGRQTFSVLTSLGTLTFRDSNSEKVMTASGLKDFQMAHSLDSGYFPTITGIGGQILPDVFQMNILTETEEIVLPGSNGNFVFYGRGWGHGVGMSQFGIYDMGKQGYDYQTMLYAYYKNTKIVDFRDFLNGNI